LVVAATVPVDLSPKPLVLAVRHNGAVIEFTDWAKEILQRSVQAARRFDADAKIRLARVGGTVQAVLTDRPAPEDRRFDLDQATVYVEEGLEGVVDIEEPHDRVVLKPSGSLPNVREHH
jgi:hypothetical protein